MALEDYKINSNTAMCWTPEGRRSTSIDVWELKNNKVSSILPQIKEGQIIRGLLLDSTDGFQQFVRINGSLYSMNAEVERVVKALKKSQNPLFYELKKYLKSEGFVWDSGAGAYEAPTNNLPQNRTPSMGLRSVWSWGLHVIEQCKVRISLKENNFEMEQSPQDLYYEPLEKLDASEVRIAKHNLIQYKISEQDIERFKADWTAYKSSLDSRLKNFAQDLSSLAQECSKDTNEIKNQGFVKEKGSRSYYKISKHNWKKVSLVAEVGFSHVVVPGDPGDLRYEAEFRFASLTSNSDFRYSSYFEKELEGLPTGFLDQFEDKKFSIVSEAIKYAEDSLALWDNSVSKMKTRSSVDLESLNTEKTNTILEALHTLRKMDVE